MSDGTVQNLKLKRKMSTPPPLYRPYIRLPFYVPPSIVARQINVKRRKAAIRVFVLMVTDSGGRLLDGHGADLGYRWLHTCLETLSSSGQWHLQSLPPVGRALWCSAPAKREQTETKEGEKKALRMHWGWLLEAAVETLDTQKGCWRSPALWLGLDISSYKH